MQKRFIAIFGILIALSFVLLFSLWHNDKQPIQNKEVQTENIQFQKVDFGHGFSATIPPGWVVTEQDIHEINSVKFGSPTLYTYFERPQDIGINYTPLLSVDAFTIDKRLSPKDVANLIQDRRIADKLDQGTAECAFDPEEFEISALSAYSFLVDQIDPVRCRWPKTEPFIGKNVIVKDQGTEQTLWIKTVSGTQAEHEEMLKAVEHIFASLQYVEGSP